MRALTQLTGYYVRWTWTPSSTSETSWINAFGGYQTHPGQSRSSRMPWLRSGRISILENAIDLSEACPSIVARAFRHLGVIPAINVSFQYDWMNGRNFKKNPYPDYHFVFRLGLGNISSNGNSPCALANFYQFLPRKVRAFLWAEIFKFETFIIELCYNIHVFP